MFIMSIKEEEIPKKKKRYLQKYSKAWETNINFRDWLTNSSRGIYFAYCSACNVDLTLNAGVTDLRKHSMGKKHLKRMATLSQSSLDDNIPYVHEIMPEYFCAHKTQIENNKHLICEDQEEIENEDEESSENFTHETNKVYFSSKKNSFFNNNKYSHSSVQEDELEIFGKHVTAQLRKLPEEYTVSLILEIQNLITQKRLIAIAEQNSRLQSDYSPKVINVMPNGSISS